jgi:hypothetical protein
MKMDKFLIKDLDLHGPDTHHSGFHTKRYYEKIYNEESSSLNIIESFDISVLDYFFKNFTFIDHTPFNYAIEGLENFSDKNKFVNYMGVKRKPTFYFKHNDYIIVANLVDKNSKDNADVDDWEPSFFRKSEGKDKSFSKYINKNNSKVFVSISYPSSLAGSSLKKDFGFLEEYKIIDKDKDFVSVLIKNQYGEYDFEPLNIKVPKTNIELNYGESFAKDIYKKIVHKLKNNNKGLYMFHGDPGTGKSSFIKHLTTVVKKEFIFIPTSFIEKFISDPDIFAILIRKKNAVLILEDAEKILISREKEDNQFISTLLNISDGILSDILEASVILTYNCDDTKIDKALKRKGRTMVDYKFNKLSVEESKKLAKHLKVDEEKVTGPMTLSEIYNMEDENKFYDDEEQNNKKIIGFGRA